MFLQETYSLEDCRYFNDGSSVSNLEIGSNVSCTTNGSYITITANTNGEKQVYIPIQLSNSDEWEYSVEIADTGTIQPIALNYDNSNKWAGHSISTNQWFANSGTNDAHTQQYQVGDVLIITRQNGYDKIQVNGYEYSNRQASHNTTFKVGFYTNNGRIQKIKNIKLTSL